MFPIRLWGFGRNEESLNTGLQAYDRLEKDLESVEIADKTLVYNRELIRMLQAENTLLCSRVASGMAHE